MKKYILIAMTALSFGLTSNAFAAATAFTGSTTVTEAACSILSQNATLNASADVNAAWDCVAATNIAYGAACHEGGSAKDRSVACTCVDDGSGGYTTNNSQCSVTCDGLGNISAAENVTVNGRQAFGGNTNGGSISAYSLSGSGATATCSSTSIVDISLFP